MQNDEIKNNQPALEQANVMRRLTPAQQSALSLIELSGGVCWVYDKRLLNACRHLADKNYCKMIEDGEAMQVTLNGA